MLEHPRSGSTNKETTALPGVRAGWSTNLPLRASLQAHRILGRAASTLLPSSMFRIESSLKFYRESIALTHGAIYSALRHGCQPTELSPILASLHACRGRRIKHG